MGRAARRVSRSTAMNYVAGYVMVNDITARDMVRRTDVPAMGTDWLQSKNGPGFLPMGPYFVPAAFRPDPYALRLTLSLNDRPMQDSLTSDMLFDIAAQIEYISQHAQLLPGDVICTGTPAGCADQLQEGTAVGIGDACDAAGVTDALIWHAFRGREESPRPQKPVERSRVAIRWAR